MAKRFRMIWTGISDEYTTAGKRYVILDRQRVTLPDGTTVGYAYEFKDDTGTLNRAMSWLFVPEKKRKFV